MPSIAEVYFLVRVGSWGEDELANYIDECATQFNQEHYDDGFQSGLSEGTEVGRDQMYQEALAAVKGLA